MSLHHLPEASSAPRKSFTTKTLFLSLVLAVLAACDKPSAPVAAPEAPATKVPTGRLTETLVGTTVEQRRALIQEVMQKTLGTEGDFYSRGFPFTQEDLKEGTLAQLDVGFGPLGGIHVVTAKQKDGKTYREESIDHNKDGTVDFSDRTVSWLVKKDDMSPPMTHFDSDRTIGPGVQDDFATALATALDVLNEEEKLQPKK